VSAVRFRPSPQHFKSPFLRGFFYNKFICSFITLVISLALLQIKQKFTLITLHLF
jgi:hypothetical protein